METAVWAPKQRALVFADALAAVDGTLRVWDCRRFRRVRSASARCSTCPSSTRSSLAAIPWTTARCLSARSKSSVARPLMLRLLDRDLEAGDDPGIAALREERRVGVARRHP